MQTALRTLFHFGPFVFGLGFIGPLIAQAMGRLGWSAPFGLDLLVFGLICGGVLGLVAQIRGRWL